MRDQAAVVTGLEHYAVSPGLKEGLQIRQVSSRRLLTSPSMVSLQASGFASRFRDLPVVAEEVLWARRDPVIKQVLGRLRHQRPLAENGEILFLQDEKMGLTAIVERSDRMWVKAKYIASDLELELGVVSDAVYPSKSFMKAMAGFRETFPFLTTRLYVEALGGVAKKVMNYTCASGFLAIPPELPQGVVGHPPSPVFLTPVVAPSYPLARVEDGVTWEHIQAVLGDCSAPIGRRDFFVLCSKSWRVADPSSKHELLRAGIGWGTMPVHMIASELADGVLSPMTIERVPEIDLLTTFALHHGLTVLETGRDVHARALGSYPRASPETPVGNRSPSTRRMGTIA